MDNGSSGVDLNQAQLESAKNLFFIALAIDIAITALVVFNCFSIISALKEIQSGTRQGDQALFSSLEFWESFSWLMILTFIGVCWSLLKWLGVCYSFAKNTLQLTGFEQEGWRVWCWWFPPINLYKPYQVVNEIYRAGSLNYTAPDGWKKEPSSGLLIMWWLFWVFAHLVSLGHARFIQQNLIHTDTPAQVIDLWSRQQTIYIISIVIAGLWFVVGRGLTQRLLERASRPLLHGGTAPTSHDTNSVSYSNTVATSSGSQNQQNVATTSRTAVNRIEVSAPSSQGQQMENLEDWAYEQVGKELDLNNPDKGLWTKAFSQAGGDDKQTRVLYIKARVEKLIAAEQARLEEIRIAQKEAICIAEEGHVKQIAIRKKIDSGQVAEEINRIDGRVRIDFMNKIVWCELKELVAMMERDPYLVAVSNNVGDTALHIAAKTKNSLLLRALVDRGANPRATNSAGKTPIDITRSKGMEGMAEWMESLSR